MFWNKFFSLKWRWLLPLLAINFLYFYMQASVIYECERGGCQPWYITYWSIFPFFTLIGYILGKLTVGLKKKIKKK